MRIFLFLIFSSLAYASHQPSPTDLATLHGDASAIVCDCVNAITGEVLLDQDDHVVAGATPLQLHRRQMKKGCFPFFPHTYAEVAFSGSLMTITVFEKSGIGLPYHSRDTNSLAKVICKLSIDACNGITHSPGYNLSENVVEYRGEELILTQSNGAKRIYRKRTRDKIAPLAFKESFQLAEEILETGQVIEYEWDSRMIKEVQMLNPSRTQIYSKIMKRDLSYETSDGHLLHHEFKDGLLVKAKLPHHPVEVQERDKNGYLHKRAYPKGRECKFKYDKKGKVRKLVFPEGLEYRFEYGYGHTKVIRPEGAIMNFFYDPRTLRLEKIEHEGRVETFKWDDWGYLLEKSLEGHWMLSFEYDEKHNLLKKTKNDYSVHYEYDASNRVILEREDNGFIKRTKYFGTTLLPKKIEEYRHEHLLKTTIYEYDEDLLLIRERVEGNGDSSPVFITLYERRPCAPFYGMIAAIEKRYVEEGEEHLISRTEYTYDLHGQVIQESVIDPEKTVRYTIHRKYDRKGRLLSETDPEGNLTSYSYDENGNVVREIHPNGLIIKRTFDACNRLLTKKEGDYETKYTYSMFQAPQTQHDYLGVITRYDYDKRCNCTSKKSLGAQWKFAYNADNQMVSTIDPNRNETRYQYENGNLTQKSYPNASQELFTYNPDKTLASSTDPSGLRIEYRYDDFGNVCNEIFFSREGLELGQTSKTYNAFHLLEEVDLEGNQTHYSYNGAGRLIEKNESGRITTYQYDPLGRIIEEQLGDHRIIKDYDLLDQVTCEEHWSQDKLITHIEIQYNLRNRTIQVDQAESTTKTTYDPLERVIRIDRPDHSHISYEYSTSFNQLTKMTFEPGAIVKTEVFDHEDQLIHFEKRDGSNKQIDLVEYEYDLMGNLLFEKHPLGTYVLEMRYDCMNRKTHEIECGQRITKYTYTLGGEIETITKPDDIVLSYEYDALGFLSNLSSSDGSIRYHFEHDKLGRLIRSTDLQSNQSTERILDPFWQYPRRKARKWTYTSVYL